jgi:hypothetical protein
MWRQGCHSDAIGAESLCGSCQWFEEMHCCYSHDSSRRSRIFPSFTLSLIRNVAKHSRKYAAESSWINFAVINFLALCIMQYSLHCTALCPVQCDRHFQCHVTDMFSAMWQTCPVPCDRRVQCHVTDMSSAMWQTCTVPCDRQVQCHVTYMYSAKWQTRPVPCDRHVQCHVTDMSSTMWQTCTVSCDRQVDWFTMNWNGFRTKPSCRSRRTIKKSGWGVCGRARNHAARFARARA